MLTNAQGRANAFWGTQKAPKRQLNTKHYVMRSEFPPYIARYALSDFSTSLFIYIYVFIEI